MRRRLRRLRAGAVIGIVTVAGLAPVADALGQDAAAGGSAAAQPLPEHGPTYPIGRFLIEYVRDNPDLPPLGPIRRLEVELRRVRDGWAGPWPGTGPGFETTTISLLEVATRPVELWHASAIQAVLERLRDHLLAEGLMGVFVAPDPAHIDRDGADRRGAGQTDLRLVITTGFVTELRTLAQGQRIAPEERINHPLHQRIRDGSPIKPYFGRSEQNDLLRRGVLDRYLFHLSRHPGRQVDAAVSAADDPLGVALDYHVTENRPLTLYGEVSNTGTESTDRIRARFGLLHTQLTDRDDLLELAYTTAEFDDTNQFYGGYEAPLPGNDRVRWRVHGVWNEFTASDVGLGDDDFDGESWWAGGEIVANVYQHRELFVDLFAGVRFLDTRVTVPGDETGRESFLLPVVGARLERSTDWSATRASLSLEGQVGDLTDVEDTELARLGRTRPDDDWALLQWTLWHSVYLEPLLQPEAWSDTGTPDTSTLAHELAVSFRGQHAFDHRLIPELEQPVGGLYTVRGYPESVTAADTALIGSLEYRLHLPRLFGPEPEPRRLFGAPFRWAPQHVYGSTDWDLVLKGFVDVGQTIFSDALAGEDDETLVGVGIGLELLYRRNLRLRLDWGFVAHELDDRDVNSGSNRLHVVASVLW